MLEGLATLVESIEGFEAAGTYNSGKELIDALQRAARLPDICIIDIEMPGMDGVELYRHIREIQPDLVAVFLTAYTTIDHVYAAVESGAERVLGKPVDFGVLIPLIEELVGKAV
jgi:two-component system response regulator YesN